MDKLSIPSMLCMYGSRCFSQDDPRWSDMTILYAMWYDAMALAYKLFALSLLLKSFISFFSMATFAQCTNQDSNCVYAGTNLWHKIWYQYMHHDDMVCMLWEVWSLMCTSNVAGNTQMASLDRQVTQNGLGVNNAMAREYTMEGYHDTKMIWRLPSLAMMSGGVPYVDTKMMETVPK